MSSLGDQVEKLLEGLETPAEPRGRFTLDTIAQSDAIEDKLNAKEEAKSKTKVPQQLIDRALELVIDDGHSIDRAFKYILSDLNSNARLRRWFAENYEGSEFTLYNDISNAVEAELEKMDVDPYYNSKDEAKTPDFEDGALDMSYADVKRQVKAQMAELSDDKILEIKEAAKEIYYRQANQAHNYDVISELLGMEADINVVTAILGVSKYTAEAITEAEGFDADFEKLLTEGTWSIPETVTQARQLIAFIERIEDLGSPEIKKLSGLYGDDDLFDKIEKPYEAYKKELKTIVIRKLIQFVEDANDYVDIKQPEAIEMLRRYLGDNLGIRAFQTKQNVKKSIREAKSIKSVFSAATAEADSDTDAVEELKLYIDNDSDLYRQQKLPIIKNLIRKNNRQVYNPELAVKLWRYLVDNGARKYITDFGSYGGKSIATYAFPTSVRQQVATEMAREFERNLENGEYSEVLKEWHLVDETEIPDEVLDDAEELRRKGWSYRAIVNIILDIPVYHKWFEKGYHGNEFDFRQELEELIGDPQPYPRPKPVSESQEAHDLAGTLAGKYIRGLSPTTGSSEMSVSGRVVKFWGDEIPNPDGLIKALMKIPGVKDAVILNSNTSYARTGRNVFPVGVKITFKKSAFDEVDESHDSQGSPSHAEMLDFVLEIYRHYAETPEQLAQMEKEVKSMSHADLVDTYNELNSEFMCESYGGTPFYSSQEQANKKRELLQLGKKIRPEVKAAIDANRHVTTDRGRALDYMEQHMVERSMFKDIETKAGVPEAEVTQDESKYMEIMIKLTNEYNRWSGD